MYSVKKHLHHGGKKQVGQEDRIVWLQADPYSYELGGPDYYDYYDYFLPPPQGSRRHDDYYMYYQDYGHRARDGYGYGAPPSYSSYGGGGYKNDKHDYLWPLLTVLGLAGLLLNAGLGMI